MLFIHCWTCFLPLYSCGPLSLFSNGVFLGLSTTQNVHRFYIAMLQTLTNRKIFLQIYLWCQQLAGWRFPSWHIARKNRRPMRNPLTLIFVKCAWFLLMFFITRHCSLELVLGRPHFFIPVSSATIGPKWCILFHRFRFRYGREKEFAYNSILVR